MASHSTMKPLFFNGWDCEYLSVSPFSFHKLSLAELDEHAKISVPLIRLLVDGLGRDPRTSFVVHYLSLWR